MKFLTKMKKLLLKRKEHVYGKEPPELLNRFLGLREMPKGLGWTTIYKWLKEFPANSKEQQSVVSLEQLVKYLKKIDSDHRREKLLMEVFGNRYGNKIYQYEKELILLARNGVTNREFWYLSSLDSINWRNSNKLSSLSPIGLLNNRGEIDSIQLSEKIKQDILNNLNRWRYLLSFLTFKESGKKHNMGDKPDMLAKSQNTLNEKKEVTNNINCMG